MKVCCLRDSKGFTSILLILLGYNSYTMTLRNATTRTPINDESLRPGVPIWMQASILAWIERWTSQVLRSEVNRHVTVTTLNRDRILEIERYLQISFPSSVNDIVYREGVKQYCMQNEEHCLDVVEAIVATNNNFDAVVTTLNAILLQSGSKWIAKVVDYKGVLEERVSQTASDAFELSVNNATNESANFLTTAWHQAYGRSPNATEAYNNAIKAMEAAAWPIITPRNNSATLGHIIGELSVIPAKWKTAISEKTTGMGVKAIADAMLLVWEGHTDRHGTASPVAVTREAAEQAVLAAVMICGYFNRGYVVTSA